MKTRPIYGCLIGLSVALSSSSMAQEDHVQAQTGQTDKELSGTHFPASINLQTEEQSMLEDLALVAKAKGWTIAEAKADYDAAEAVGKVAVQIAKQHPELFVGSVLSDQPGGTPMLYIKGATTRAVRDLVNSSKIYIEVKDNQPYSFREIEQREMDAHSKLAELGYQSIATWSEFQNGPEIYAQVSTKEGLPKTTSELERSLPDAMKGSIRVSFSDEPVGANYFAFGGMVASDGGNNECTMGWSVRNGSGTTGVTTAGHCNGIDGTFHPGVGTHGLVHRGQHRGAWGDIEWKTSNVPETARFYASSSAIRNVNSLEARAAISVGESICVYGRFSNVRNCSRDVSTTSFSCTLSGIVHNRLVRMDGAAATFGDSGGGWSWGNRAYGSVVGVCGGRAIFSVADLYDEALGVRVITQ